MSYLGTPCHHQHSPPCIQRHECPNGWFWPCVESVAAFNWEDLRPRLPKKFKKGVLQASGWDHMMGACRRRHSRCSVQVLRYRFWTDVLSMSFRMRSMMGTCRRWHSIDKLAFLKVRVIRSLTSNRVWKLCITACWCFWEERRALFHLGKYLWHENYIVQTTDHRHIEGLSWKRQHNTLTSIPPILERLSPWAIVNFPNDTEFNCGSDVNGGKSYNDRGLRVVFEEQQSFPCEEKEQDVRDSNEIVHGHGCERCLRR